MTVLCLFNNISRHIKITSMILNCVTEICSNFLDFENEVFVLIMFLKLHRKNEAKFGTK